MSDYASTACAEVAGTRTEGRDKDCRGNVSVQLMCAWGDRWALADELVGGQVAYPFANHLFATQAAIRGFGEGVLNGQVYDYSDAIVTITYTSPDPNDGEESGEDLIAEALEPTAEFMTLDYHDFTWDDGTPLKEGEAPGKLQQGLQYKLTVYHQSSLPGSILTLPGYVNSNSVSAPTLGLTFPAGTLLFKCPTTNRTINTDGDNDWTINYAFAVRYVGWNKFWRAKTGTWATMKTKDGSTYKNFPEAAF